MMTIDRPLHRDKTVGFRVSSRTHEKATKRARRERRSLSGILRSHLYEWAVSEAESPPVLLSEGIRARKEMSGSSIPTDLRWQIWERDNFTCQHCGTRRDLSLDHIIPQSKGGPTTYENLTTLCRSCNSRKHDRL